MQSPDLRHNADEHRYEILVDGEVVGFADYVVSDETITLPHTEVDPEFQGQGLASDLVQFALDDIAAADAGLRVVPSCPYVATWIKRHPEYERLL